MLSLMRALLRRLLPDFIFFAVRLRFRIIFLLLLNIIVGVLDGLGLSMFLPLLHLVGGAEEVNSDGLGNLRFLVDGLTSLGIELTLGSTLIIMTLFFLLKGGCVFLQGWYETYIQQFFIREIRLENLDRLNVLSFSRFSSLDAGRIQNSLSGEVDRVARAFSSYFLAFQQGLLMAVYIGFALTVDFQFALLVCIGGAATNLLLRRLYAKTKASSRRLTDFANRFQGLIIQYVSGYRYLKATGFLEGFSSKLRKSIEEMVRLNRKIGVVAAWMRALREPLIIMVVAVVIMIQTVLIGSPLGPILVSLLFFYRALTALMGMQTAWNYFLGTSGSLIHLAELAKELEAGREQEGSHVIDKIVSLELRDAHFSYGAGKEVLSEVQVKISGPQAVAIVGESGSGKTTLVNLLVGLMTPQSGELLINGLSANRLSMGAAFKRVGYVPQDPVVFNDSLYNNVTLWAPQSPENLARFYEAMQAAHLTPFMESLTFREHTIVGSEGISLSGGQRQRISIARELFRGVDVMILDEATASLDAETERMVQASIDKLRSNVILIVVAHRLATIRNVDRVIFLSNGKIIADGAFSEVRKLVPEFDRMVNLQMIEE